MDRIPQFRSPEYIFPGFRVAKTIISKSRFRMNSCGKNYKLWYPCRNAIIVIEKRRNVL